MLVRLMLPVSLIETQAFKEFMKVFDPSFNVPTRNTVKTSGLDNMFNGVQSKIQNILDSMTHVNVSVDGWSDAVIRCYNGYIVQGIDTNWQMHTIPIAFQHVTGSHTGKAIKQQFEEIATKFNIRSKVFKIVADQAANVKNAFKESVQADDVLTIATDLIRRQKNSDAIKENERLRLVQESVNREELEKSIEEANSCDQSSEKASVSIKRTAAQVLLDEDEFEDSEEAEDSIRCKLLLILIYIFN